jgi:hypothetical protein
MGKRQFWSDVDRELLKQLYPDTATDELARRFNRTSGAIYQQAQLLKLHKTAEFKSRPEATERIREIGAAYRFNPDQSPWNKGMKGLHIGGNETRFKRGLVPHNTVAVGTELMSSDGYLKLKIGHPDQWVFVHRRNWEEAHGPIPKGMCVAFKDGNRENCAIENLQLLTRGELIRRNSIHNYPPEVIELIRMRAGLIHRINHMEKKRNEK